MIGWLEEARWASRKEESRQREGDWACSGGRDTWKEWKHGRTWQV